jgi:RNA polymerase sigma-70 factor (ECF subfamily)
MASVAKAGSPRDRYAAIARSCERDLLRHANRLTGGDVDWAKDLVQDALIAGYQSALEGKLDESKSTKAWLLRILTNRFINQLKRKRKWESAAAVEDADQGVASAPMSAQIPHPDARLMNETFTEAVDGAVRKLPEDQRLCVLCVDIQGLSYEEAASALQIPIGTVRSRLARARLHLHDLLIPFAKSQRLI